MSKSQPELGFTGGFIRFPQGNVRLHESDDWVPANTPHGRRILLVKLLQAKFATGDGLWACDLLKSSDIRDAIITMGEVALAQFGLAKVPSVSQVGQVMRGYGLGTWVKKRAGYRFEGVFQAWIVRNTWKYHGMTGTQLRDCYRQGLNDWAYCRQW